MKDIIPWSQSIANSLKVMIIFASIIFKFFVVFVVFCIIFVLFVNLYPFLIIERSHSTF